MNKRTGTRSRTTARSEYDRGYEAGVKAERERAEKLLGQMDLISGNATRRNERILQAIREGETLHDIAPEMGHFAALQAMHDDENPAAVGSGRNEARRDDESTVQSVLAQIPKI